MAQNLINALTEIEAVLDDAQRELIAILAP
jgi:hypothetical protein